MKYKSSMQSQEVTVDSKVLSFGVFSLLALVFGLILMLVVLLYDSYTTNVDQRHSLLSKDQQIYDLRRSLDKAEARLGVYDEFLLVTQVDTTKRLAAMFMRDRAESAPPTLDDFLNYISGNLRSNRAVVQ